MVTTAFHGRLVVRVAALSGERWNCRVTAPPPFTARSNLAEREERACSVQIQRDGAVLLLIIITQELKFY